MTDITGNYSKIQQEEAKYNAAVSQSTQTKVGANVNKLIDETNSNSADIAILENDNGSAVLGKIKRVLTSNNSIKMSDSMPMFGSSTTIVFPHTDTALSLGHYYMIRIRLASLTFTSSGGITGTTTYRTADNTSAYTDGPYQSDDLDLNQVNLGTVANVGQYAIYEHVFQSTYTGTYEFETTLTNPGSGAGATFSYELYEVYTDLWT